MQVFNCILSLTLFASRNLPLDHDRCWETSLCFLERQQRNKRVGFMTNKTLLCKKKQGRKDVISGKSLRSPYSSLCFTRCSILRIKTHLGRQQNERTTLLRQEFIQPTSSYSPSILTFCSVSLRVTLSSTENVQTSAHSMFNKTGRNARRVEISLTHDFDDAMDDTPEISSAITENETENESYESRVNRDYSTIYCDRLFLLEFLQSLQLIVNRRILPTRRVVEQMVMSIP